MSRFYSERSVNYGNDRQLRFVDQYASGRTNCGNETEAGTFNASQEMLAAARVSSERGASPYNGMME